MSFSRKIKSQLRTISDYCDLDSNVDSRHHLAVESEVEILKNSHSRIGALTNPVYAHVLQNNSDDLQSTGTDKPKIPTPTRCQNYIDATACVSGVSNSIKTPWISTENLEFRDSGVQSEEEYSKHFESTTFTFSATLTAVNNPGYCEIQEKTNQK